MGSFFSQQPSAAEKASVHGPLLEELYNKGSEYYGYMMAIREAVKNHTWKEGNNVRFYESNVWDSNYGGAYVIIYNISDGSWYARIRPGGVAYLVPWDSMVSTLRRAFENDPNLRWSCAKTLLDE